MHTSIAPPHPTSLGAILTPPGGGCLANPSCTANCATSSGNNNAPCGYGQQCVTRNYFTSYYIFKWCASPLADARPTRRRRPCAAADAAWPACAGR